MPLKIIFPAVLCWLLAASATAQTFTGQNSILVRIEGTEFFYEYTSDQLLVRLDRNLNRIECVVNTSTFVPYNDASPQMLLHDVFYTQKHPQFWIVFDAPMDQINAGRQLPEPLRVKAKIIFQGITADMEIPMILTAERNFFTFTSEFDFRMQGLRASLPRGYKDVITGRIFVTLRNARWVETQTIIPTTRDR